MYNNSKKKIVLAATAKNLMTKERKEMRKCHPNYKNNDQIIGYVGCT